MSMPHQVIFCDSCEFESSARVLPQRAIYKLSGGRTLSMEIDDGWCHRCEKWVLMEKFSDDEIRQILKNMNRQHNRGIITNILAAFSGISNSTKSDRGYLVRNRTSPPRCTTCGSINVERIMVPPLTPRKNLSVDIKHPGCGGNLYCKESSLRLAINFDYIEESFYDENGIRI